jgi:hypothetical protein
MKEFTEVIDKNYLEKLKDSPDEEFPDLPN